MSQEKKNKSIAEAIRAIHKQFGSGSIMRLDGSEVQQVEVDPDRLGRARRRARLRRAAARPHRRDLRPGVVRQDHADAARDRRGAARRRRVRVHRCRARARHRLRAPARRRARRPARQSSPTAASKHSRSCDTLVRTGAIDLIVVDSVAALTPRAEIEGEMGDSHMGLQARLMSQALRKLTAVISKTRTIVDLHQPAAAEDRRRLRQPRDDDRRQRAQVLLLGAARHPPQEGDQARRGDRSAARSRSRSSRTSARRRSARPSSRSCTAPASTSSASSSTPPRSSAWSRSPAPGTRTAARRSARAATRCSRTSTSIRRCSSSCATALIAQAKRAATGTNGGANGAAA